MMHGEDVALVQLALRTVKPDGWFGPKTSLAVRKFQADHRLVVDGIVGPRTAAALHLRWDGP